MIVKRVRNPKKSAGKAERIERLAAYILSPEPSNTPESVNRREKCIHAGTRGFLSGRANSQVAEMQELALAAVRSPDPVNHYVLSWRQGETPPVPQVEEAVDMFLGELDLADHQAIYGLHDDTDNIHLHVMVNRVHPVTERCVEINGGFDLEAAHKAIARIEAAQGWAPEPRSRYKVLENGELGREHLAEGLAIGNAAPVIEQARNWAELHQGLASVGMRYEKAGSGARVQVGNVPVKASAVSRKASLAKLQKRLGPFEPATVLPLAELPEPEQETRQPDQPKRDMEHRTGEKSAERLAIENAAPVIEQAWNWAELHQGLASVGMRYEKAGSGAKVWVGDVPVKASAVSRKASLAKLQKRLGAFEPATVPPAPVPAPEPLVPEVPGWDSYAAGRRRRQGEKAAARKELDTRQARQSAELAEQQRKQRLDLTSGDWTGLGLVLNAWRMVIAVQQAAARAALRRQYWQQLAAWRERFPPWPDIEDWLRVEKGPEAAEAWRHRQGVWRACEGRRYVAPEEQSVLGFTGVFRGSQVQYFREGGRDPSFVDRGWRVEVLDWRDREAVRAALELCARKWGDFVVTGCSEFKALSAELAAEHGYRIVNPELQVAIEQHKRQLEQKPEPKPKSEPELVAEVPAEVPERRRRPKPPAPSPSPAPGGP